MLADAATTVTAATNAVGVTSATADTTVNANATIATAIAIAVASTTKPLLFVRLPCEFNYEYRRTWSDIGR